MNKEYIEREALIEELKRRDFLPVIVKHAIEAVPAADVVEVVLCKDCAFKQYWFKHDCGAAICGASGMRCADESDFCSYGERKADE